MDHPDFLTELAKAIGGIEIYGKPGPYPADPDTTQPLPKVSQSDGVAVYLDKQGKPIVGLILEVQRRTNPEKAAVWPIHQWTTARHLRCKVYILVFATSRSVGDWARNLKGGIYADYAGANVIVADASNVSIPDENAPPIRAMLAAWLRTSEPDWETAAAVAVKTLQSPEDYDTFISGLEKPEQLSEVEDMVNVAEKPWFHTIVAKAEAKAAKEAATKAEAVARAEAARKHAEVLKLLAKTHPDITPTVEAAEKDALAAEAKLAELSSNDE